MTDFLTILDMKVKSISGIVAECSGFVTKEFLDCQLQELQELIDKERTEPKHSPFPNLSERDAKFMQMMWGASQLSIGQLSKLEELLWFKETITNGKFAIDLDDLESFGRRIVDAILELADDIKANDKRGEK